MTDRTAQQNQPKVPWSGRGSRYTDDDIEFIVEAIRTADPLTQGHYQSEFEDSFRQYTGARHAYAVSSCTAALHLAAVLSRLGPGDEVVMPTHTFAASPLQPAPFRLLARAQNWFGRISNRKLSFCQPEPSSL